MAPARIGDAVVIGRHLLVSDRHRCIGDGVGERIDYLHAECLAEERGGR